jgi:hypothetical protein
MALAFAGTVAMLTALGMAGRLPTRRA